mmetsp:Transcript_3124/g.14097  ORF Transcript_3124/g.14097 Transcript_3124/m.14097 type:complete len:204 (+) Transcript_3124:2432-3043(+)
MGAKYLRVYRFTPQKSRCFMYRSEALIHAAAPHVSCPTRCCLVAGRLTFARAVPHRMPSSFTASHKSSIALMSFSTELPNWHLPIPKFSARSLSQAKRFQGPLSSLPTIQATTAGCLAARMRLLILPLLSSIARGVSNIDLVPSSNPYPTTTAIPYLWHKSKKCVCLCECLRVYTRRVFTPAAAINGISRSYIPANSDVKKSP